jgi:acyl carrier protein
MNSPSRTLVHHYLASRLRMDQTSIHDALNLDELGVDPLDLVLIVLRLEDAHRDAGEFPIAPLEHVTTVADLVTVVDRWLQ